MRRTLIAAALAVGLAMPVRAEPGPIGQWLMSEPVTLWDWGMMRMESAAEEAGSLARLLAKAGSWDTFVFYSWRDNEIEIVVEVFHLAERSHVICNRARRHFLFALGAGDLTDPPKARQGLYQKIGRWFSHEGYGRVGRDDELAEKLSRIIYVNTRLWDDSVATGIECRARITEFDAPSKPLSR